MKKIVSVLALAALTFGTVSAEISFSYTGRATISEKTGTGSNRFNLAGGEDDQKTISDCLVFELSNDVAGVVLDIDPHTTTQEQTSAGYNLDQYYGWIDFLDGKLRIQSGKWGARHVNRVNQDGGQWNDDFFEKYQLGVQNGKISTDVARLAAINGDKKLSGAATYTDNDLGFFVSGVIIDNVYNAGTRTTKSNGTKVGFHDPDWKIASGFALEAGYQFEDVAKFNLILKAPARETYGAGFFAEVTAVENLDVVTGFSFGSASKDSAIGVAYDTTNKVNSAYNEWAFDLRARYQIDKRLAITTMHNLSSRKFDDEDKATLDLWDMVSLAIQAKDNIKFTVTGEWTYENLLGRSLNAKEYASGTSGNLSLIPGVEVSVADDVSFTSGIIVDIGRFSPAADYLEVSRVAIPFIFHVGL